MNRAAERRGGWGVGGFAAVCMGLGLTCLGIFLLLSFATADVAMDLASAAKTCWTGLLGVWVAYGTIHTLGTAASVLMAMLITFWGLLVAKTMRWFATWPQVVGGVLMLAAVSLGVCGLADSYDMDTGGLLAIYVSPPAVLYFGRWGLVLAAAGVLIVGILLAFGETAVYSVHWAVYCVRDGFFGIIAIIGRLFELVKMLFTPRLAVAGGVAAGSATTTRSAGRRLRRGKEKNLSAAAESRDTEEAEEPDDGEEGGNLDDTVEEEISGAMEQEPRPELKEWKPREGFQSRYLNLDLRHDATQPEQPEPAPAQPAPELKPEPEPVTAAIAPQPQPGETGEFPSGKTVIMDVDAEAEESDVVAPDQPAAESAAAGINDTIPDNPAPTIVQNSAGPILVDPLDSADADGSGYPAAGTDPVPATPPLDSIAAAIQPRSAPAAQPEPARPTVAPRPNAAAAASGIKPSRPGAYGVREEKPPVQTDDLANYRLPPLELLDPPEPPVVEDVSLIEAKAKILEQTLAEFKIEGRVVHVERGPRVTLYEISLAPGIRLNKVTSLADNIAMQLKAESIRIIAPIPGKNTIGIEIPNTNKELVSLKEIVSAVNRDKRRQALPICLGKDISGSALVADLARMPHLLIAGATGSGKSVCINSIILSIMMCCRPDEAQMIMVDPKVVELSRFKDIPHLMSPVITDMKRAVSVLEWICQKMDERYEYMSQVSVNNIAKFNALGEEGIRTRLDAFASLEEIEAFPKKMPYMVVIIDELADLMMVAGKEVEQHITRLAAKSRAVGIHLILATQRPSVDVITGLIKANMPSRIAFQVASKVDSRTILDQNGADNLLGQGDMLFLPPGVGKLTRAQGVFVSDDELFRVVDFTKAEAEPQYHEDLLGPVIGGGGGAVDISDFDELFIQSGEAIIENQRGSVSLLQRKFGIGYGRASRIIDQLESVGLLGQFREGKAREILMSMEDFRGKFGVGSSGWDDDDDAGEGFIAGLRDDERERPDLPWEDSEAGN